MKAVLLNIQKVQESDEGSINFKLLAPHKASSRQRQIKETAYFPATCRKSQQIEKLCNPKKKKKQQSANAKVQISVMDRLKL